MRACSELRRSLEVPRIDKGDAAIATSLLLKSLSFADTIDDFQVPLRNRSVPFSWLINRLSLKSLSVVLQVRCGPQELQLISLDPTVEASRHLQDQYFEISIISEEFAAMLGVDEKSARDDYDYLIIVSKLCRLLAMDPADELAVHQYMQFVEELPSRFIALLNTLDTRALVLLSYWLALLCAQGCWWSQERARIDCLAICEHLEIYASKSIWLCMDFPAAACGYPYIDAVGNGQRIVQRMRTNSRLASSN